MAKPKIEINPIEKRAFQVEGLQVVADETREKKMETIRGHAAVFNKTADLYWFKEKVAPGAFKESIGKDDIRALFNHDENHVLGRNVAGTLRLNEDETGLAVEIEPPDTQTARDLVTSIKRGDVSQMSFAFRTLTDEWHLEDGDEIRVLIKVQLFDVSPVTFPAYTETDVSLASARNGDLERIANEGRQRRLQSEGFPLAGHWNRQRAAELG